MFFEVSLRGVLFLILLVLLFVIVVGIILILVDKSKKFNSVKWIFICMFISLNRLFGVIVVDLVYYKL